MSSASVVAAFAAAIRPIEQMNATSRCFMSVSPFVVVVAQ